MRSCPLAFNKGEDESLYSSIDNPKLIRSMKWYRCTRLKSNRLVDPDHTNNRQISEIKILPKEELFTFANTVSSRFSELFIRMEMLNIGQQISSVHQNLTENRSRDFGWNSEEYHRGIKQCCGIERCFS